MLWLESGRWDRRGPRKGQYVMARHGDKGAYEIGNVRICSQEENHRESDTEITKHFGEANGAFGKNYWATMKPDDCERRRASMSAKLAGRKKPSGMSERLRQTVTGRRRVVRDDRRTWAYPGDTDYPGTF